MVVQVKDVVVIRSHITVEFEDPAFCNEAVGSPRLFVGLFVWGERDQFLWGLTVVQPG